MASRKGQFKKGGGRVGSRSSSHRSKGRRSKSIVVHQPKPIIVRTTSHSPARRHSGGGRRRGGGGGGGELNFAQLGKEMLIGAAFGYTIGDNAPHKLDFLDKLPTVGKLPREALIAGAAFVFRKKHRLVRDIARVGAIITGNKIGAADFKLSGYYDD